ncbi:hypothetical protein SLEP1_g23210 [Rubroshorea leprosula]|uniref:Uncharacterized protein n=1 Tax=Rubroshorea leprosula TaxID=152421 RepID=A0AAV5JBU6_9ROSI|nr:hypothetical protein SLEP1_g23210 [Rubroshorea leprosula]
MVFPTKVPRPKSRMMERDSSLGIGSKKVITPRGTPKTLGYDEEKDDVDDASNNIETRY